MTKHIYIAVAAFLGWFAILAQLDLSIMNRTASVAETVIRYFTYFTILSNILVALCFSATFTNDNWSLTKFFRKATVNSAVLVYIIIVGVIYNLVLKQLWNPQGLQKVVDGILHTTIPMLFTIHWLFRVDKGRLAWKDAFSWLIFPLCYILFVLARGYFSDFYPYPFIDVATFGYPDVLQNCGGLFVVFLVLSLLVVGIAKLISKYTPQH